MKLGTLLLRNAAINLSQLETALRSQVLYGGRLGTNLVELGFIDVSTLAEYLAEVLAVPQATQLMLNAAEPEVIRWFGADRAQRYVAFPLGYLQNDPQVLGVAVVDPRNEEQLKALAQECGSAIAPHIAPELRIYYYLEKHYGITRRARYVRTASDSKPPQPLPERRRTQPAQGIVMPPKVLLSPKRHREADAGTSPPAAPTAPVGPAVPAVQDEQKPSQALLGYSEASDAIANAANREEIGETLLRFAVGRFAAAVVFLLRDRNAVGWRMYMAAQGSGTKKVETVSFPLGGSSVLQMAYDSQAPYRGGPASAGKPIERMIWDLLNVERPPEEMLVVPIVVAGQVVNLIYAHCMGGGPIEPTAATELAKLAEKASDAYTRLLDEVKQSAPPEPRAASPAPGAKSPVAGVKRPPTNR